MKQKMFRKRKRPFGKACRKGILVGTVALMLSAGFLPSEISFAKEKAYTIQMNAVPIIEILREGEPNTGGTPETSPSPEASPSPDLSPTAAASASPIPSPTEVPQTSVKIQMNYKTGKAIYSAGGGGSTKFYLSTNKKRTWELLDLHTNVIDLNGLLKSSDVKIYFKGNKDQEPVEVTLKGEKKGLKAAYTVVNGAGKVTLTGATGAVEYRIGKDGNWADWVDNNFTTAPYEITGVTLQYREKATEAERSGKIVSLKIPKRPAAPSVKVDGDKFVLTGMKPGTMQYRLNSTSNTAPWTTYQPADGKSKYLDLVTLLLPANTPVNTKIPGATIEIRTMATEKKPASAVRTIEIPAQRSAPTTATVRLEGTTLTCTDASSSNQYEYTMLHVGETLDLQKAKWTTVRSSKPVLIKKTGKAETIPGDTMVIRLKVVKDSVTKEEGLPSQYLTLQITSITPKTK